MSSEENWIWLDLQSGDVTVGVLCKKKKTAVKQERGKQKVKIRHVMWTPGQKYEMLKKGQTFLSKTALVKKFEQEELREDHLFIFKLKDAYAVRSADMPMYEGVFYCSDAGPTYVLAQKKYLRALYALEEKVDFAKRDDTDEQGVPYWVDRHLFSVANEKANKKRQRSN